MSEINFKPFQKVLVRSTDTMQWSAALYSHKCGENHICNGLIWKYCINWEGNEHLLGTPDNPEKSQPEFKFGDKVTISYNGKDWSKAIYIRKVDGDMPHEVLMQVPWHYGGQEYHVKFCRHEKW